MGIIKSLDLKPRHVYSEKSVSEFSGTYSQVNDCRWKNAMDRWNEKLLLYTACKTHCKLILEDIVVLVNSLILFKGIKVTSRFLFFFVKLEVPFFTKMAILSPAEDAG